MPDTALASWPACLDDVDELTARLRSARVPVGMGDELRLRLLLERLQARATPIANTEDATHWLSPILCRNADQKKALLVTLNQLESEQASRGRRSTVLFRPAAGVTAQTEQEAAIEEKVRRDRREVHTAWTIAAVVAVGLSIWFFAFFSATKPPDVKSVDPAACTTPPCPKPAPTPIPPTTPQTERAAYWWSFELGLLPIVTALTFIMLRRRRRAFLMRGLVPRETPQDSRMLPISIDVLFRPDRMRTPAADWRRDRWEESNRFDVKRSIDRTVRAGGEFKIVNARRRIIPEYILLVDRTGTNDMMAVVADHLAARLTAEQVNLVRFDYYGDPRRVVPADPAEVRQRPQRLDDLLFAKRDTHQLVILADPSLSLIHI